MADLETLVESTAPTTTASEPVAQRTFEQLIDFARECVADGTGFKRSTVLAFMRELVAIADSVQSQSTVDTAVATDETVSSGEKKHVSSVTPSIPSSTSFEVELAHYAALPGGVMPELVESTGAIRLPIEASGLYDRPKAMCLAARLIRIAR